MSEKYEWTAEATPHGAVVLAGGAEVASCKWVFRAPGPSIDVADARRHARLISAAPDMLEALKAYREADEADDAMREAHERATAEDWINDPTGSLHVRAYVERYNDAVRRAADLRDAAIAKATGEAS